MEFLIYTEITLNSAAIKNPELTTHSVGEILQLGVWVHNSLSQPLVNIMLELYLFQDYQNGTINQKLDTCLTTIGSTEINLSKVSY